MAQIKILAVGDVVGDGGVDYLSGGRLRRMASALGASLTIVNGENSSRYNCITPDSAEALFDAGADVITGGNHTFKRHQIYDYLDSHERCLRPLNYPGAAPGEGFCTLDCEGLKILVVNLMGTTFMEPIDSPFKAADSLISKMSGKYDLCLVDFHAEATSEKLCLARYLDGRATAVFGTHTHVQTADATVLNGGTGYITDLGMTGPANGVLGVSCDVALHRFLERTPVFFEHDSGSCSAMGALFTIDTITKKCTAAEAVVF